MQAPGAGSPEMTGGVASILRVTEAELVRPTPFVALQVIVRLGVSDDLMLGSHPEEDDMPLSGSLTDQVTVTGIVVFHPVVPGEGVTVGTIIGGVVSPIAITKLTGKFAATRSPVARVFVFPAESARKTVARVHFPVSLPLGTVITAIPFADVLAGKLATPLSVTAPEGLVNAAWKVVAPERSSVT